MSEWVCLYIWMDPPKCVVSAEAAPVLIADCPEPSPSGLLHSKDSGHSCRRSELEECLFLLYMMHLPRNGGRDRDREEDNKEHKQILTSSFPLYLVISWLQFTALTIFKPYSCVFSLLIFTRTLGNRIDSFLTHGRPVIYLARVIQTD